MKLHFGKTTDGEIFVKVDDKEFVTRDYIQIVKEIKKGNKISADYDKNISPEEKAKVEMMLGEINQIDQEKNIENEGVDVDPEEMPF